MPEAAPPERPPASWTACGPPPTDPETPPGSRPAYTVFADATLRDIAVVKPTSLPQLSLIHGVGANKLQEYGGQVLALLRDFEAGG